MTGNTRLAWAVAIPMDIVVWIVSGALALVFVFVGLGKLTQPKQKLLESPQMAWTEDFSEGTIKLIGALEVLGGIGLVLPWATGVATILTPLAAVGLVLVMIGAAVTHVRRGERQPLPINLVLGLLALFVAVMRFAG